MSTDGCLFTSSLSVYHFSSVGSTYPGLLKESPISLASNTYRTLAEGKPVSFVETSKDTSLPEWKRVLVNGNIQVISAKEVCYSHSSCFTHLISPFPRLSMESSMSLMAPFRTTSYAVQWSRLLDIYLVSRLYETEIWMYL